MKWVHRVEAAKNHAAPCSEGGQPIAAILFIAFGDWFSSELAIVQTFVISVVRVAIVFLPN